MVFKRRDPRSYLRMIAEVFWPRGGWTRAFHYVKHRIRRLPDDPHRIARGVGAGVFVSFTPFFGLHFITAALSAKIVRGNILASLLGTFFGNPITFPIIAFFSMKLGKWMLGTRFDEAQHQTLASRFMGAAEDLRHNFFAMFTPETAHWGNLSYFYHDIFVPYLIGGLVPGIVAGVIAYYLSEPVIAAYQKHRRKKLKERFEKLKAKLHARVEEKTERG
ncbi:MAG: DUF2062 domain-containing protein [Rhodobacteraceae bacterium]|uniref:DUF2062 domain-containing protein n=1 Tax=Albidovulum sp. TaxID=1872424 RepID=UPI0026597450|nr:DUF2062 domain-containing protein [uncultured Defluviimonas sp.]MCC0069514.1 DUF2062 domain-containing protein [Paracoccaceae bacterium]